MRRRIERRVGSFATVAILAAGSAFAGLAPRRPPPAPRAPAGFPYTTTASPDSRRGDLALPTLSGGDRSGARRLTPKELEAAAWRELRQRNPGFAAMKLALFGPSRFDGSVCAYTFQEIIPENGALTSNGVYFALDPYTGRVAYAHGNLQRIPRHARRQPAATPDEALAVAVWATGSAEILRVERPRLHFSQGRLRWVTSLNGLSPEGGAAEWSVTMDADRGTPHDARRLSAEAYPRPLAGRAMVARRMLATAFGPVAAPSGPLLDARIVEALGGRVAGDSGIVVRGERDVAVAAGQVLRQRGRRLIPVSAIARAFPRTVLAVDVDRRRNAVNLICEAREARRWARDRGRTPPTVLTDRFGEIARAVVDQGLAASPDELRALAPPYPPLLRAHYARTGLWAALALGVVGVAVSVLRRRRRAPRPATAVASAA